jgi:hypothetical protein
MKSKSMQIISWHLSSDDRAREDAGRRREEKTRGEDTLRKRRIRRRSSLLLNTHSREQFKPALRLAARAGYGGLVGVGKLGYTGSRNRDGDESLLHFPSLYI